MCEVEIGKKNFLFLAKNDQPHRRSLNKYFINEMLILENIGSQ